jgi:hypothetical protein
MRVRKKPVRVTACVRRARSRCRFRRIYRCSAFYENDRRYRRCLALFVTFFEALFEAFPPFTGAKNSFVNLVRFPVKATDVASSAGTSCDMIRLMVAMSSCNA